MRTCLCACSVLLNVVLGALFVCAAVAVVTLLEPALECNSSSAACTVQCVEQVYAKAGSNWAVQAAKSVLTALMLALCGNSAAAQALAIAADALCRLRQFATGQH